MIQFSPIGGPDSHLTSGRPLHVQKCLLSDIGRIEEVFKLFGFQKANALCAVDECQKCLCVPCYVLAEVYPQGLQLVRSKSILLRGTVTI